MIEIKYGNDIYPIVRNFAMGLLVKYNIDILDYSNARTLWEKYGLSYKIIDVAFVVSDEMLVEILLRNNG